MNTRIAVSVLSADFARLGEEISKLAAADLLHLDIMDGHYVPNLSFGYPIVETVRRLTDKPLDVHLMVTNPTDFLVPLAEIGIQWLSFHPEIVYHPHRFIQEIKSHNIKAGAAINPGTPVSILDALLPELDFVLLMSVNPGYSGQSFIPSVIDKIKALANWRKEHDSALFIEVDGGVNDSNAEALRDAGADILVSASYIFNSLYYNDAINTLKGV